VRSAFHLLVAVMGMFLSVLAAFVIGGVTILPFVVVPRGRRERYTMPGAVWWASLVLHAILFARPRVTGQAEIAEGGALFLCNHRSWLDPLLLMAYTRSQGLSKREILYIPFVGMYGWLTGAVFFDRSSPAQRSRAREETMQLVRGGHRIHVFPEGTRSRSAELGPKVYLTLVRDCFDAGVPVVPCAVWATDHTLPPGRIAAIPCQACRLDIGAARHPRDFPDAEAFAVACWADVSDRVGALRAEAQVARP
jgi:1-acyl-sn-glycerol-3-phosphate acyltransferase